MLPQQTAGNHTQRNNRYCASAFSLVELSVVLVILALLTGAILAGNTLLQAADLRAVGTELHNYQQAVYAFKTKYNALPGDMHNATDMLSSSSVNGDGNHIIRGEAATNGGTSEGYMMWRHLAEARLIEGEFTGRSASSSATDYDEFGVNVPASSLSGTAWNIDDTDEGGSGGFFDIDYPGHRLELGGMSASSDSDEAAITPEDAWHIDTKLDDGAPARGNVVARFWNNSCTTVPGGTESDTNRNAVYNQQSGNKECALLFLSPF